MATELAKLGSLYRGQRAPTLSSVMAELAAFNTAPTAAHLLPQVSTLISSTAHPKVRRETEFAALPSGTEMTQTLTREEVMFRMMTRLSDGRTYSAEELASLADNYPIGIFVKSNHEAIQVDGILETAHPDDVKGVMSYVLPRFVNSRHFKHINNADVQFTDDPESFFADGTEKFIPNNRSRVYSLWTDEKGKSHITFLLRHNIKENYTDAFELVSFMGFIETARAYGKKHTDPNVGYMVAGLAEGQGMSLSKGTLLHKPWEVESVSSHEAPKVMRDVVDKIDVELKALSIDSPRHVLFGNDFSVELLIGTGVIQPEDFAYIQAIAVQEGKGNKIVSEDELVGLKKEDDKEIMRQFSALQYLNRYFGGDTRMVQLKLRLEGAVSTVRKRIIQPTHTALGSFIDVIDFANLGDNIIQGIDNEEIKGIVQRLKNEKFNYYSLPYPLGDSMHGIVRAFKNKFNIDNYGFFGKVGAVPTEDSRVARGRVVLPKRTTTISVQRNDSVSSLKQGVKKAGEELEGIRDFPNLLAPEDVVVISHADTHTVVASVNGLTLQSQQDFPRVKKLIRERHDTRSYSDLLLDMEADYFNDACQSIGVVPAAIYYVSDLTLEKTQDPYASQSTSHLHTIVNALGVEGTLASVVSPFTILKKWLDTTRAN